MGGKNKKKGEVNFSKYFRKTKMTSKNSTKLLRRNYLSRRDIYEMVISRLHLSIYNDEDSFSFLVVQTEKKYFERNISSHIIERLRLTNYN